MKILAKHVKMSLKRQKIHVNLAKYTDEIIHIAFNSFLYHILLRNDNTVIIVI